MSRNQKRRGALAGARRREADAHGAVANAMSTQK